MSRGTKLSEAIREEPESFDGDGRGGGGSYCGDFHLEIMLDPRRSVSAHFRRERPSK